MLRVLIRRGVQLEEYCLHIDSRGRGMIDKKVFLSILNSIGIPLTNKDMLEVCKLYTVPSSDEVDYETFFRDVGLSTIEKINHVDASTFKKNVAVFANIIGELKDALQNAIGVHQRGVDDIYRMFARWDVDGTGSITATQFFRVLARLHIEHMNDQDQDFLVELLDTNSNGRVDFDGLLSYCFHEIMLKKAASTSGLTDHLSETGSASSHSTSGQQNLRATTAAASSRRPHTASVHGDRTPPSYNVVPNLGVRRDGGIHLGGVSPSSHATSVAMSPGQSRRPVTATARVNSTEYRRKKSNNGNDPSAAAAARPQSARNKRIAYGKSTGDEGLDLVDLSTNSQWSLELGEEDNADEDIIDDDMPSAAVSPTPPDNVLAMTGNTIITNSLPVARPQSMGDFTILERVGESSEEQSSEDNHSKRKNGEDIIVGKYGRSDNNYYGSSGGGGNFTNKYRNPSEQRSGVPSMQPPAYPYLLSASNQLPPEEERPIPWESDSRSNSGMSSTLTERQQERTRRIVARALITMREAVLCRHRTEGTSLQDIFRYHFDRRRCGHVNASDLKIAAQDLNIELTTQESELMLSSMILDSNQCICLGEFLVFVTDIEHNVLEARIQQEVADRYEQQGNLYRDWLQSVFFQELDATMIPSSPASPTSETYIPAQPFTRALHKIGVPLTQSDVERLLLRFDVHGMGQISITRFFFMITDHSDAWKRAEINLELFQVAQEEAEEALRLLRAQSEGAESPSASTSGLDEDIVHMAAYLGIGVFSESRLLGIVADAIRAPLPTGWEVRTDKKGRTFFYSMMLNKSRWDHPLDPYFRSLRDRERFR